jgi:hypothetical protein
MGCEYNSTEIFNLETSCFLGTQKFDEIIQMNNLKLLRIYCQNEKELFVVAQV